MSAILVGEEVGEDVGEDVGAAVGLVVGEDVGEAVGAAVGLLVTSATLAGTFLIMQRYWIVGKPRRKMEATP